MFLCSRGKRQAQTSYLMSFCPSVLMSPALATCPQILEKHVLQHKPAKYPPQNLAYTQVSPTFAPLDIKKSRPSAHRQISTFARQRAQTVMSAARERKIARFFLHAATRWHSASYARFKRNSRKFLQNFFAKNLVCVPKVRTFALANQK